MAPADSALDTGSSHLETGFSFEENGENDSALLSFENALKSFSSDQSIECQIGQLTATFKIAATKEK